MLALSPRTITVRCGIFLSLTSLLSLCAAIQSPSPTTSPDGSDPSGAILVYYEGDEKNAKRPEWIENLFYAILYPEPNGVKTAQEALRHFNQEELTAYLRRKDVLCTCPPLTQAIHYAVTQWGTNYLPIITVLLESKHFDINKKDEFTVGHDTITCTPYFAAVANGHFHLAELLLSYGANPAIESVTGTYPITGRPRKETVAAYATRIDDKKIITWLRRLKPAKQSMDDEKTPLNQTSGADDDCCCCCSCLCRCLNWLCET